MRKRLTRRSCSSGHHVCGGISSLLFDEDAAMDPTLTTWHRKHGSISDPLRTRTSV
jgi:hypothetical protein